MEGTFCTFTDEEMREREEYVMSELFDNLMKIISNNYDYTYLGDGIYNLVHDAMVDAIAFTKEEIK